MWCIPYDRASSWRSYFSLMLWCIWLPFYYPYILSCWCWCYVHANTISGKGVILCIENALADSGVTKEDINYINAHATSTQMGDLKEFEALNRCFGQNPQAILYFRILYFRPSNLLLLLFLAKEANFWFSQFSWANVLLICIADTSELNEVDDRPSARSCRWNRSCCCYTSKEINVTFPVRVVCLFSFYYSKVCTFIESKILIS